MFPTPDTETLRLCSVLSSSAFGFVLAWVWFGQREARYLLHWSASALLYAGLLIGFRFAHDRPFSSTAAVGALIATNMLLISGLHAFDGRRPFQRWMLSAVLGGMVLHTLPTWVVGEGPALLWWIHLIDTISIALSALAAALAFLFSARHDEGRGRRIAGVAMMAYMPGYAITLLGEITGFSPIKLLALIPMLSDQLLLCMLNLGLLAMPAERAQRRLRDAALRDPLTGVWNRAGFEVHARRLIAPGAIVLAIDLDHFKRINDQHGHFVGDQVLLALARLAGQEVVSLGGEFGRLGGDEFLAILPPSSDTHIAAVAARIRQACRIEQGDLPAWEMSVGAAEIMDGEQGLQEALKRADHALYQDKFTGRLAAV